MTRYKISDLENFSGVKAHTIRIWEQRYKILVPHRTATNIRYYDDDQLRKLLNVVSLMNAGHKISEISKLNSEEINLRLETLNSIGGTGIKEEMLINQMITAALTYDENMFEKVFSNSILSYGLMNAYQKVFYPMMIKLGFLWSITDINPSQEHFVSSLIRQKMFAAIDSLNNTPFGSERWLLFLPEDELHDIGLLIANYGLRSKGKQVFYLGENVPMDSLNEAAEKIKPTHFLTFSVVQNQEKKIQALLTNLALKFKDSELYICCDTALSSQLKLGTKQKAIVSFESFDELLHQ